MRNGILFDLDGTLWDSAENVTHSWNHVLQQSGRNERLTVARMYTLMGKTTDAIAAELFPEEKSEEAMRILKACMEEENSYLLKHGGRLYDNLEEVLKELKTKGYFLGIVSNCQEGYIEAFLTYHHLEAYFDDTENYGRTGYGKGTNIRLVMKRGRLGSVLYLGDTRGDYEAAKEAGVFFLHAAYGFGSVPGGTPSISDIRLLPDAADRWLVSERGKWTLEGEKHR